MHMTSQLRDATCTFGDLAAHSRLPHSTPLFGSWGSPNQADSTQDRTVFYIWMASQARRYKPTTIQGTWPFCGLGRYTTHTAAWTRAVSSRGRMYRGFESAVTSRQDSSTRYVTSENFPSSDPGTNEGEVSVTLSLRLGKVPRSCHAPTLENTLIPSPGGSCHVENLFPFVTYPPYYSCRLLCKT